jgi:hypothetical protein
MNLCNVKNLYILEITTNKNFLILFDGQHETFTRLLSLWLQIEVKLLVICHTFFRFWYKGLQISSIRR